MMSPGDEVEFLFSVSEEKFTTSIFFSPFFWGGGEVKTVSTFPTTHTIMQLAKCAADTARRGSVTACLPDVNSMRSLS